MLDKVKKIWKLAETVELEKPKKVKKSEPIGDGKATFISEGTVEDFENAEKEASGMSKWLTRLKNLV